ncbi:hypothetical protein BCR33DRAFT_15343 [Rhizoclosmatium globosum]|uniref:Centromere/kinetochore protein zw10 middle domain-containing protein n=1 Tax=Rhizoclosmatium globosum TaxID=329046 RepID=A0A1Y2CPP5_9FUNG|nr:hypothetical protein BCR33DRAFT_15343 [Rhizoclosmatium globosum]|eukprot:ORY48982.1 hypothetical protein BCR33DRAFT_15343 [Rhizoclosmatium globosum]
MSSFVTSVLGFVDAAAVEVDSATGLPSGVAGLLRHIHIQFGDLRSDDVDLVVAALERRINDVKAQTEDILLAHEDECQSLLASALAQEQDTRDRIVDLKTRVNHVQHPVTGLLHVRKSELEQEKEAQRAAEREERLTRIHSEVNAFTESAEACKLILTEFGDLVDAVDTLNDLEISLEGIVDCEEVIPRSSLEDVFENVKTMIVQRVEDAFSNVFVIQPQEGSVTITTRSAVRVSNPEIPAQPIFIQTESLLKVIKTLNIHIPLYSNLSRSLMKSVLKPVILNPGCTLIISDEKLRDQDEINIGKLNIRFESNQNTSAGISDGLTKLTTIFQFISQNFFSSTTPPPHDLVQSTWSNLASTIIDHLLTPLIPTTPETLKQFPTTVAKPCIEFEDAMEDLAWVPLANENWRHLKGYCGSVETHYCVARWEMFMEKGREAMLKEDFETVVIGGITEKFDISKCR